MPHPRLCAKQRSHGSWINRAPYQTCSLIFFLEEVMFVVLHRSARKVSLLKIKSNQVKRPLYAKDSSPLNVEPKVELLLGLWFWFSWGSCNRTATASTYRRWSARRNVQRCYRLVFHQWCCCFIAERASSLIRFNDLEGKVIFKPGSLKYRADPLSQLACFILPLDGTGSVLRKRLNTHLQNWVAKFGNLKLV